MHKKYHVAIVISNTIVLTSLFFPLINVNELRIGTAGAGVAEPHFINIVSFLQTEIYPLTGFLMIALMVLLSLGIANSIYGLVTKRINSFTAKASFLLGFSSAVLAALLLYSRSSILFIICVVSFVVDSVSSIQLFRAEEAQNEEKQGD